MPDRPGFFLRYPFSAVVEQIIVHFLNLSAGQLVKLYIAEAGNDMFRDVSIVVVRGALAYVRLRVYLKP